jgi:hypothetical protein
MKLEAVVIRGVRGDAKLGLDPRSSSPPHVRTAIHYIDAEISSLPREELKERATENNRPDSTTPTEKLLVTRRPRNASERFGAAMRLSHVYDVTFPLSVRERADMRGSHQ